MSNRDRDIKERPGPAVHRPALLPPGLVGFATLVGVAVLIFLGAESWKQTRELQQTLGERLTQIETRMTQLSAKVDAVGVIARSGAAAPQAQRGPDPNKAYAVKTDGAPYTGPKSAPITIAEFSDFQ